MKMLELFAGRRCMSKAFERVGWETYSVEWSHDFPDITLYKDIAELTADEVIDMCGGRPDVIWLSPDCTTFSIAGISHHRTRNPETGNLDAKSEYAKFCDRVDQHCLDLINELKPKYWFIENPRGGMRKMSWMQGLPRYTACYCQYGDTRMKPTDIWTNYPDPHFKMCKNGNPDHEAAPRGSKTGTQGLIGKASRSEIPEELCDYIAHLCTHGETLSVSHGKF